MHEAAYRIIKGATVSIDLTEITFEYEPAKKVYSFLSFAWAIFADIDIGSEAIRCCGPTRFTVWGVWRTLFTRDYFGSMRYIGEQANAARVIKNRNIKAKINLSAGSGELNMLGSAFENDIES